MNRVRGRLRPIELATAAVMGAVTVILVLAGWLVPHASALMELGVVPMAVVGHRHRPRAVVAAAVAAGTVAFLVAGTGPVPNVALCAVVGGIAGHAHRRCWAWWRVVAAALVAGPLIGGLTDLALVVFAPLRRLTLENLRDTWVGYARILYRLPALHPVAGEVTRWVGTVIRDWWQTVLIVLVSVTVVATVVTWRYTGGLLRRLAKVPVEDRLGESPAGSWSGSAVGAGAGSAVGAGGSVAGEGRPLPVPVELRDVTVRYPRAREDAIAGVSLCVRPRQRTVLLGPNGSGKSTLARLLAGSLPTSGTVARPGPVGLGRPGGTALVSQQPESQVLGVRVADDVVWGLPADWPVDVDALLAEVGLAGLAPRETSALSGGQLQRLALAAAIARRPQLLVADEVTAMVDAAGREEIVALLRHLPAHHDVAVVQVTHRVGEVAGADRVTVLQRGRIVSEGRPEEMSGAGGAFGASTATPAAAGRGAAPDRPAGEAVAPLAAPRHQPGAPPLGGAPLGVPPLGGAPLLAPLPAPLLVVDEVSHTYAVRTPWAQPALHDVSLSLAAGDGILVLGDNGSGKSTLAWVMAGLLRPSAGECLLGGRPVTDQVGRVALAFQHARLQVLGTTVGADVRAAGGVGTDAGKAALRQLGLDPAALWDRPVDELSGGQLRRVALAGLLAGGPRVVILDEPLAGLDEESRAALLDGLARLRSERGLTLVVISHDLEAATICDRLLRLDAGRLAGEERLAGAPTAAPVPAAAPVPTAAPVATASPHPTAPAPRAAVWP